jgi:hypothetical protein
MVDLYVHPSHNVDATYFIITLNRKTRFL